MSTGTDIGTDTICAATTSFDFHPKPFALPYTASIDAGAADARLWHSRHGAVATIGLARYNERPLAESRSPVISFCSGCSRIRRITSDSQSEARSSRLVGFSVASL